MKKILYSQHLVKNGLTVLTICLALTLVLPLVVGIQEAEAAIDVKKGTFYKRTSAGTQAITGVGFQPKAILFWATLQTAVGNSIANYTGYGFTAGVGSSASVSAWSDRVDPSNTGRKNSVTNAIQLQTTGGTDAGQATLNSFDADGFTLDWASANATGYIIHYYAIGGSDLTTATTSSIFINTTDATRSVSNLSFQPEMLFFLNGGNVSATSTDTARGKLGIGFGNNTTDQGGLGLLWEDASGSSDTCSVQRVDQIEGLSNTCNTADSFGNISSFDANGFTLNISDLPSANFPVHFLALKGGTYKTGNFLKPTATGYATTTGLSFQPKGLMLLSRNKVAGTTVTAAGGLTVGVAASTTSAGTDQGAISINEPDADAQNDENGNRTSTTTVFTAFKGTADTLTGEADFTRFNSDGFTLNWTTADATADEILYWAIGDNPPVTISGTCKQNDQSTDCTDTGTIKVAVDGVLQAQTQATVAGTWSITGVAKPTSGAIITVFIDGVASSEDRAVAVTKYDGTGDITSVELIEGRLSLGSADNQTLTNADIAAYDNSVSGDADIPVEVDAANDLVVDSNSSWTGEELYIGSGEIYRPDSASSGNVATADLENNGTIIADGNTLTISGSWVNSGTFTANTSRVIFNGAAAGTISGTLVGTSAFNKIEFNNSTGSWTVQNSASTTAANATDTFVIKNGTVTLGDGTTGINVEVNGKVVIAGTAGETGTLQTAALTQGATTTVDINNNAAPATCANCVVAVGASSGAGQGNLKIRKNTLLRLNQRESATASDTGIEVASTGYLEIQGTQEATNTVLSFSEDTASTTVAVSGSPFAAGQFNAMAIRFSTASTSRAFGKVYDVIDTTTNTIIFSATTSPRDTNPDVQNLTACAGNAECVILPSIGTLVTSGGEHVGRYLHNVTDNKYYLIASTTNAVTDEIRIVADSPDALSTMGDGDDIEITDYIQANDSFEILDYALVTNKSSVTCTKPSGSAAAAAFINARASSESIIRYADICGLGRNADFAKGVRFDSVNGTNANEGYTVDRSRIRQSYLPLSITSSSNNNQSKGVKDSILTDSISHVVSMSSSDTNAMASTTVSRAGDSGISVSSSNGNTFFANRVSSNTSDGFLLTSAENTRLESNHSYLNGIVGMRIDSGSHKNILLSNLAYGNYGTSGFGMYIPGDNNVVASSTIFLNGRSGIFIENGQYNAVFNSKNFTNTRHGMTIGSGVGGTIPNTVLFGNSFYSNVNNGLMIENGGGATTTAINESYGVLGSNGLRDIELAAAGAPQTGDFRVFLYNSILGGSPFEITTTEATSTQYIISRKHDGDTASTTIWGKYVTSLDFTETPQNEAVDKFNYADNLWEKSATAHGYTGTGSEDSNLDYDLSTATLSAGPYSYLAIATSSGACAGRGFEVYRNAINIGTAYCGTQFTDSDNSVKFKIDGGTPVNYAARDTYTFTVWDASNNTNVQKKIGMMTADGQSGTASSTFTVSPGATLELKGQGAGSNLTEVTRAGTSDGYAFAVQSGGTIDASNYSFNYGGGTKQTAVLNLYDGATITSLDNGSFDNFAINNTATSSYIALHSGLIGTGQPSSIWDGLNFLDTNGNADCNVNATSTDATGYWEFTNYTGAFAGDTTDCNDGLADPDPGQLKWTPTVNLTVSGTIYSDEGLTPLNTAGKTILLRVGTSTPGFFATTTIAGTGVWRIDNLKSMSANATVRAWLDDDATFRAFSLTKASSTSNIPNLDLYKDRLIVRREGLTAASTTITDLAAYDADNDADIQFRANGGALNVFKDQELHIWAGNPFVPGGAVTLHGNASSTTDGSIHLDDNAAYSAGGVTTVAGNWDADTGSLFTSNNYDVVFNATTTGKTIAGTLTGGSAFATTTFNGSGGGWTFSNNASTTGLTITAGALTAPSGLLSIAGQYANNAGANGFAHNSGTTYFTGTSTTLSGTMTGNSALNHVIFKGPVTADTPGTPSSTASTSPTVDCVTDSSNGGTQEWDFAGPLDCETNNGTGDLSSGYARMAGAAASVTTYYLKATNFGFTIPTDATIDGILVDVERMAHPGANNSVSDSRARIIKGGTIGSTDKAKAGAWGQTAEVFQTYGSPTDTWGETWTPSDINSSTFGFAIAAAIGGSVGSAAVDMIRIKVHYTTAGVAGSGGGTWSFGGNASTTNFTIANGTTTAPSGLLSIAGNYTNNGGFTHNSGKVYLSGTTQQTVAGNLTSPSAFNNLDILNTIGTGDATQSVIFSSAVSASSTFTMLPSTSAQFLAGATSTFQNIDWNGIAAGTRAWLRSSSAGVAWLLKVLGTRIVSFVNVKDSDACSSDPAISATDSTNAGGNTCWTFLSGVTGGVTTGGGSTESSGSAPPVEGGTPGGGGAPEGGGTPSPPVEGGGGGGGGDVGYRGGTNNLAAAFASQSFERILRAVIKVF